MKKIMHHHSPHDAIDAEIDRLQHMIMMKDRVVSQKLHLALHRQNICRVFREVLDQFSGKSKPNAIADSEGGQEGNGKGLNIDVEEHIAS